jgi:hypothetical protein
MKAGGRFRKDSLEPEHDQGAAGATFSQGTRCHTLSDSRAPVRTRGRRVIAPPRERLSYHRIRMSLGLHGSGHDITHLPLSERSPTRDAGHLKVHTGRIGMGRWQNRRITEWV